MVNFHYLVYVEHSDFPAFFVNVKQLNVLLTAVQDSGQSVIILSFVLARPHYLPEYDKRIYNEVLDAFKHNIC